MNSRLPRLVIVPRALLIVEELGGFAAIATELRRQTRETVATLWTDVEPGDPGAVAIITGRMQAKSPHQNSAPGSFSTYGVDVTVSGGTELPELLGRWLIEDYARRNSEGHTGRVIQATCFESIDEALAAGHTRLLVLVDGAFGLADDSPVGVIEGAAEVDALCSQIAGQECSTVNVENAEFPAPGEYAAELWLQLSKAAESWNGVGMAVVKRVYYDGAPYGIGYHVASWLCVAK
ncbi:hypothetical protein HMPREF3053_04230 [Corynebacterium sp. HMSC064E07]|uniref:hypothetical protein n=1 Tax=Corynebacterium sp. HMSC064E07 TaxID=1739545 RepID=UPI0008A3C871|nr:hypothetical protein [Corynebacterium sp. HMSC064E07]OFO24917.1 hypothetical protein HMPREF3053_04230 [Corynebacterium sp. HMSC064E07]